MKIPDGMHNLHSTMLLLYRTELQAVVLTMCLIYIPLCFYFIDNRIAVNFAKYIDLHSTMLLLYHGIAGVMNLAAASFTFHYASTLSDIHGLVRYLKS